MSSMVWNPFCWLSCFIFMWFHLIILILRISGLAWVWPPSWRWQPCSGGSKKLKKAKTSMNYNRCFKRSSAECSPSLLCLLPRHLDGHFVPQFFLHTFQTLQVGCLVFVNGCMFEFVLVTICAQKGEDLMSGEVVLHHVLSFILISHISVNLIGLSFPCIHTTLCFIVDWGEIWDWDTI